jgi:hypothetical protein
MEEIVRAITRSLRFMDILPFVELVERAPRIEVTCYITTSRPTLGKLEFAETVQIGRNNRGGYNFTAWFAVKEDSDWKAGMSSPNRSRQEMTGTP